MKNGRRITVSAPGKLMLLGEHAVLYGRPCLVTAVDKRMHVTVENLTESEFILEAKDVALPFYKKSIKDLGKGDVPRQAKISEFAVRNFQQANKISSGIKVTTNSQFSDQIGLGSSSSLAVCIIKALAELFKIPFAYKQIFDLSYKTILDVQGKGSGFDVAVAIYGGIIYFQDKGRIIEKLPSNGLDMVVGYSGQKAETVSMINLVSEKMKDHRAGVEKIFDNIASLVDEAKKALLEKDWERLGVLINYNQVYLEDLGVSTDKLNQMITAARKSGAYGAKLSGAGGGDCIIALVSDEKRGAVEKALSEAGGTVLNVKIGAEGVRVI